MKPLNNNAVLLILLLWCVLMHACAGEPTTVQKPCGSSCLGDHQCESGCCLEPAELRFGKGNRNIHRTLYSDGHDKDSRSQGKCTETKWCECLSRNDAAAAPVSFRDFFKCITPCPNMDPCLDTPCKNGGTCSATDDGSFTCACPPEFTLLNDCSIRDPCLDTPCKNGGTCSPTDDGNFTCDCPSGFTLNDCSASLCERALDPAKANILHCRDGEVNNVQSAWTLYFKTKGYINYQFVNGDPLVVPPLPNYGIDICLNLLNNDTKQWDAVILEEADLGFSFDENLTVPAKTWAENNPNRPLILFDWDGTFFGGIGIIGFEDRQDQSTPYYDTVFPIPGRIFDQLMPLQIDPSVGWPFQQYHVTGGPGTELATSDINGTAFALNGNVWGFGPASSQLATDVNNQTNVFAWLEVMLCCENCTAFTLPAEVSEQVVTMPNTKAGNNED